MHTPTDAPGKTIKSVETAIRLLDAIYEREEAGVTELAAEFDLSKSTIHHYVKTLEHYDCLENVDGRYRIGLRFLTFGGQARAREKIYQLAKHDVDQLAEETGEEVRLVVERNGYGVTVYQAQGAHVDRSRTHVGSIEELHCTAAGKAFLAALPDERVATVLEDLELTPHTERTITDRATLEAELETIRTEHVAFDEEERFDGVRCVASAITTRSGDLLGAISVSGSADRLTGERYRRTIPDQIRNIAGVVEINTTYSEWA
ncbi:IclR family transcriptional regulator [Natronobiforma cellulositropha]|uniref:IclR family transcriptional regulator n=1 Tax=Natronobiforma cellulositropha TaxID=1679076 RepID=UPI0021D58779|nr:IclR family transcriptional regulator [Natronobiforma cellulositropha]